MDNKICRIVGAGEFDPASFSRNAGDVVLAADGGLEYLRRLGVAPDLTLGDFDSLGYTPENADKHPTEKDDTDMLLAVKYAMGLGCRTFYIYGGLGGRLSHTLANMQTLKFIKENGCFGFLVSKGCIITSVADGETAVFSERCRGLLSVFAAGGEAEGVCISGMKYPLENYAMLPSYPIGTSNAFTGAEGRISVSRGTLALIWEDGSADAANVSFEKTI